LVDAQTGNRVWGDQYNRRTSDLISLQSEIARDVSEKLKTKISGADERKLRKSYTENVEAYQVYLKGRYHVFKLTVPEVQKSIEYFQKAIEIDPSYALAYAGLSDAYRSLALAGELDPNETLPKSKAAANKAIEIDGDLAEAHTALGVALFWYDWNWTGSEEQYKRALELNPNSSVTHVFYAHLLSNIGRHPEALAEVKRARELDPLSPFVNALEGQFLLHAGHTDEALDRLKQASELDPNFFFPHQFAASSYIEKGMYGEAVEETRRAKELAPSQTVSTTFMAYALAKLGKRDEARVILDELLKQSTVRFIPPYHIALIYHALGETNQSLIWLEKGYELHDPKMAFLKVEPKWNTLRADPRFQELMKKLAFPL
jgi:tetratricopeptide (TPR) repeat protein